MCENTSVSSEEDRLSQAMSEKIIKVRQRAAAKVLKTLSIGGDLYTRSLKYIEKHNLEYISYEDFLSIFESKSIIGFDICVFMMMNSIVDKNRSLLSAKDYLEVCKGITDKLQTYTDLLTYSNSSFITEKELQDYIYDLIPNLKALKKLPEDFQPFYTISAVRRMLFYLDPHHSNTVSVHKLVNSEVLEEFIYLNRLMLAESEMDPAMFISKQSANWFNGNNAWNLYSSYLKLDVDRSGKLNKSEFMAFTGTASADQPQVKLTAAATGRIFELLSVDGVEIDYKGFIDFVLIMENKTAVKSKKFFWNLLNMESKEDNGSDTLTATVLSYFYYDVGMGLLELGCDAPSLSNVMIELTDMIGSRSSSGISYRDVMDSPQGHTVMLMLLDVNAFWAYDNRESLLKDEDVVSEEELIGDK